MGVPMLLVLSTVKSRNIELHADNSVSYLCVSWFFELGWF